MPERFRLQFGPYFAPKIPRKQKLFCEYRGWLRVSPKWSEGLISWPRRYRTGSIILCGDLVRAVKMESVAAICYHWGVCRNVVQVWRKALGVEEFNPGTKRMLILARAGPESRVRQRAMLRATHPRSILEYERKQHESEHLLVSIGHSRHMHERIARTGRHINPGLRLWTEKEDSVLGTATDAEIAKKIRRTLGAVRARRATLGIPSLGAFYPRPWTPQEEALLGTMPDRLLAKKLKRKTTAVEYRREIKKIPRAGV
jgi:hypothetical protein